MPEGHWNVGAELAALRGSMDTGFARVEGRLEMLVQSQENVREDVKDLQVRVAALEERRMPLGVVAAVAAVVSAAGAFAGYLVH